MRSPVARLVLLSSLVLRATALVAPTVGTSSFQLASAVSAIEALERTADPRPHSLLDGMFDEATGLCSEGVWHNALLGTSRVLAARQLRSEGEAERAAELLAAARLLGDSLYQLSFDGSGFQLRSNTGFWEAASDATPAIEDAGENPAFYAHSEDEHRCLPTAAAVVFYSLLAEEAEAEVATEAGEDDDAGSDAMTRAREVGDVFKAEFFDDRACRFRRGGGASHWRAVDQALGCLACLRLARLGPAAGEVASSRAMATCAADCLLRNFGYSAYATEGADTPPGAYLGKVAPRNSWHDGLASFALLASGVLGVGGETPAGLVRAMAASYRCPQTTQILHRPRELRSTSSSSSGSGDGDGGSGGDSGDGVAYTGSQALWSAVVRAAELSNERSEAAGGADVPALRAWHEAQLQQPSGLLPVANVHQDARLWANTEWAAFVLLSKEDFDVTGRR